MSVYFAITPIVQHELQNHAAILDALPVLDRGQTQSVVISFCCDQAEASDMASQLPLEVQWTATGREARMQFRLAPGDL